MTDTNQTTLPTSWLGFKLINQAAADAMSASVLPSANSLAGRVWVALNDAEGDALYVAGIVVGVSFTASAVRYSVAFPVAPQPREGVTMYAVVDNIESSIVLAELPEDESVYDAVLTEDAAKLLPVAEVVPAPVPVMDSANPLLGFQLQGELGERKESLESAIRIGADPLYILGVARDVLVLTRKIKGEAVPEFDPTSPTGYAKVLKSEALAIEWQDRLDSFFGGRIVDVRNALRALGWDGQQRGVLSKNGIIARFDFWQVGAGKNVVGMTINGIRDDLTKTPDELAAEIDAMATLPEPTVDPVAAAIAQAVQDPFTHEAWTLPTALIQGMTEADYSAIIDALTAANHHAEVLAMRAARTGNGLWHQEALTLLAEQRKAGYLTPALSARSRQLAAKIEYATNRDAELTAQITSDEIIKSAAELGAAGFAIGMTSTPSQNPVFMNLVRNLTIGGDTWKAAYDAYSKAWHAANAAAPVPEPTQQEKPSMDTLIKIAADTLAQLRRIDVYRVLNSAGEQRAELATYIATGRPDLAREVTDVMAEEWPELDWKIPAAVEPEPVVADAGSAELTAAGFKNVSGNEWAKGVQGESGKLNLNIRVFGTPAQFKLKKSASFAGGISGSPSQEVGTYGTAAEAIAAARAEAEAFQPAPAAVDPEPVNNPQRANDMAFLNSVISGNADMWADDLADKIEAMGTAYDGDAEVLALWGQAIQAYTDYMVKAMG
jgi:hypothetical protein